MMSFPKRILIVDDEPGFVSVLKMMLEHRGYEVTAVYSGEACIKYLNNRDLPDLVILDLTLPRMSGYEVCAAIRTRFSTSIPVIIHTARDSVIDQKLSKMCRADAFVNKPTKADELDKVIKDLLPVAA